MPKNDTTMTTDLRRLVKDSASKYSALALERSKGSLTWGDADPSLLRAAAQAVTEDGAGLLLSKTSDGGALCLQVWTSASRHKLYPASIDELVEALQLVIELASS